MGRANDTMAVVDVEGRVFGTRGLRVVDASVFPLLPPGHPQATVCEFPFLSFPPWGLPAAVFDMYGVGGKAADFLYRCVGGEDRL